MNKGKVTIGNVCFLIDKDNNVLLLERAFEPMKGMYTGVGGKTKFEEDIHNSCKREIKEETGLEPNIIKLRGVLKTILNGHDSSWILFIYVCTDFTGKLKSCSEGTLKWIPKEKLDSVNLIGFIKEILPYILYNEDSFFEGTIVHDKNGEVHEKWI